MNKTKFFSSLLVGALVVSTGLFTSCKDYDDDISNLESKLATQEASLKQQIATLQTALDQAKADAATAYAKYDAYQQQIANNATAAAGAAATADAAATAAAGAAATADAAATAAGAATTAAEAAAAKAESALEKAKACETKAAALEQAIQAVNDVLATKADQTAVDEVIAKIAGIDSRLIVVEGWADRLTDLEVARKACEANIANQQLAIQQLIEALLGTDKAEALKRASAEIGEGGLDAATLEALKEYMNNVNNVVNEIAPDGNVITMFITRSVSSIVLNPYYYINGIEAVTVPVLQNYQMFIKDDSSNEYDKQKTGTLNCSLGGVAEYLVNPSSAELKGWNLNFYSHAATTRSGENYVKADSAVINEDYLGDFYNKTTGALKVGFKVDVNKINKLAADQLPIIALELSREDTLIRSDFAMVEPLKYYNFVIADKVYLNANKDKTSDHKCDWNTSDFNVVNCEHLHTIWRDLANINDGTDHVAGDAMAIAPTVKVNFDKQLNLAERVATHFDYEDFKGKVSQDQPLNDNDFKALGLRYEFETIDYTVGSNKTSESKYIILEGGIVTPCGVTADGKPSEELKGNRASLGRLPIVRVKLMMNNDVLAVGYYKIQITEEIVTPDPEVIVDKAPNALPFTKDDLDNSTFYVNCENLPHNFTTTWSQISYYIYSKENLSKDEFETNYVIEQYDAGETPVYQKGTDNAAQFEVKNITETGYVYAERPVYVGTVKEIENPNDPTTNVLKWILTENDLFNSVKEYVYIDVAGNETTDKDKIFAKVNKNKLSTIVRYHHQTTGKNLYYEFSIPEKSIHFPVAKIENTKSLAYWFNYNSTTAAANVAGAQEVRVNVPVPVTSDNETLENTEFTKNLHEYFIANQLKTALLDAAHFTNVSNTPQFTFTTPNPAFGNASFTEWKVKGISGAEYTLTLNPAKDAIMCGLTTIVTLDNDGVITFVEGDIADDILNYASHSELGEKQTFSAYIKIDITDGCRPVDLISDQYFNVRFLRPVTMTAVKNNWVKDAPNDWQTIDLSDLASCVDWRNYKGVNYASGVTTVPAGEKFNLNYYGVNYFIAPLLGSGDDKLATIMTDANLGTDARWNDTNVPTDDADIEDYLEKCVPTSHIQGLKLQWEDATYKTLKYKNNGASLSGAHLIIPVSMEYVFGKGKALQKKYSIITIKPTEYQPVQ